MDATGAFKTVLEQLGFRNVEITEIRMAREYPEHVLEWSRGDDEEMTDQETADVTPYYRVTSIQGSFGIVIGPYDLIDLKETGYSAKDLSDDKIQEDSFLINSNDTTLKHLKRLLEAVKH